MSTVHGTTVGSLVSCLLNISRPPREFSGCCLQRAQRRAEVGVPWPVPLVPLVDAWPVKSDPVPSSHVIGRIGAVATHSCLRSRAFALSSCFAPIVDVHTPTLYIHRIKENRGLPCHP